MKVALVHDWLIHMRGGEKVLEAFAEIYPDATIYTLFYDRRKLSPVLQGMRIRSSFLQYLPGIRTYYRWLLPILPWVIRTLEIEPADLVVSSSHCVAKGARIPEGAKHICYCHTPMRYLWGFEQDYFGNYPALLRSMIKTVLNGLRNWDLRSNRRVDYFVSNSENVRNRIQQYYERDAVVIYPPFDASRFQVGTQPPGDYYLVVSAFVPYKRVDLVIEAFNELDRQLLIVGSGPLASAYQKMRKSGKISFLGSVSGERLHELYARAKALIFPTFEDFGIVPVEAQACGTPVIAFRKGGALESVKSGVFFDAQTPESLREAVYAFEKESYDRKETARQMAEFDKEKFKQKFRSFAEEMMNAGSHVARP